MFKAKPQQEKKVFVLVNNSDRLEVFFNTFSEYFHTAV